MVTIYSKNNCPACDMSKRFFNQHSIPYEEVNLEEQPDKVDYVKNVLGVSSLPVTVTDEGAVITGFNPSEFRALVLP